MGSRAGTPLGEFRELSWAISAVTNVSKNIDRIRDNNMYEMLWVKHL